MPDRNPEVKAFVDEIFTIHPVEAAKMSRLAKDGRMGFGPQPNDYGLMVFDDRGERDFDRDKW